MFKQERWRLEYLHVLQTSLAWHASFADRKSKITSHISRGKIWKSSASPSVPSCSSCHAFCWALPFWPSQPRTNIPPYYNCLYVLRKERKRGQQGKGGCSLICGQDLTHLGSSARQLLVFIALCHQFFPVWIFSWKMFLNSPGLMVYFSKRPSLPWTWWR